MAETWRILGIISEESQSTGNLARSQVSPGNNLFGQGLRSQHMDFWQALHMVYASRGSNFGYVDKKNATQTGLVSRAFRASVCSSHREILQKHAFLFSRPRVGLGSPHWLAQGGPRVSHVSVFQDRSEGWVLGNHLCPAESEALVVFFFFKVHLII